MNNIIIRYINHIYLFSLLIILIFYLFPGDIVTYFIYGDFKHNDNVLQSPISSSVHWVINTGGYSFNHTITFIYATVLGLFIYFRKKNFFLGAFLFIFFSVISEILHFIIPNRSFEFMDLLSNLIGVLIAIILFKKFIK